MVTINYIGRFGNNLFQYVFARLLAEKNGLKLETPWCCPEILTFSPNPDGRVNSQKVRVDDQHQHPTDLHLLERDWSELHVEIKGYFQHPAFYDDYRDKIRSWLSLPAHIEDHSKDVVCHLRLGDYDVTGGVPIIDWSWYVDVLKREPGKRVFIVHQGVYSDGERAYDHLKAWERQYLDELASALRDREVHFIKGRTLAEDFHFIRSFGSQVISNSSMAWWAAWSS